MCFPTARERKEREGERKQRTLAFCTFVASDDDDDASFFVSSSIFISFVLCCCVSAFFCLNKVV